MNSQLTGTLTYSINTWEDPKFLDDVKKVFCSKLTDTETLFFFHVAKKMGLNPFLGEIDPIKYGNDPMKIVIRRDGYRAAIKRHGEYAGYISDAIYSNDDFFYDHNTGKINHTYNMKDRGKLTRAYAVVHMSNSKLPFYANVRLDEYDKNHSCWKTMKETMLKKCAESQAIRAAVGGDFNGTYSDAEYDREMKDVTSEADDLNVLYGLVENTSPVLLPSTPDEPVQPSYYANCMSDLVQANSMTELNDAVESIKNLVFTDEEKAELRNVYRVRKELLITQGENNEAKD